MIMPRRTLAVLLAVTVLAAGCAALTDAPKTAKTGDDAQHAPPDPARQTMMQAGKLEKQEVAPENRVAKTDEDSNVFTHTVVLPHVKLVEPRGGEVWHKGRTYTIRWTSEKVAGNVRIRAETGKNQFHIIADNCPNTGSYDFEVPRGWPAGFYRVEITSLDDGSITDMAEEPLVVVPYRREGWADVDYKIDPQSIEVRVMPAGQTNGEAAEYHPMNPGTQTDVRAPVGRDLDLEFRVPIAYLGAEPTKRLLCTITLSNDRIRPDTAAWQRLRRMLWDGTVVTVKRGRNVVEVWFRLLQPAIEALGAFEVPTTVEVSILAQQDDARAAVSLTSSLRLLPEGE